jgi:uncharacterized membrane protein affecting hemolysin expression
MDKLLLDSKHIFIPVAAVLAACGLVFWAGYNMASISKTQEYTLTRVNSVENKVQAVSEQIASFRKELLVIANDHEKRLTTLENTCVKKK